MSASEIATNETLVSIDDTDLTKLSAEELLAVVAELRQENKTLLRSKNKVGLTFKRIPEDGNDSITRLEEGQFPYLTKIDSLSVTKDDLTNGNIALIEGENLAALAALQMTHKEKVDVIYIDPPYNTGNDDFIYEDKRMYRSDSSDLENLEETLDGKAHTVGKDDPFRHSKWLSFMERRLFLAKELLNETGIIFVAIDDNEHHRLRLLLDQVFGSENFIENITWQGAGSALSKATSGGVDYMLVYAKNKNKHFDNHKWVEEKVGVNDVVAVAKSIFEKNLKNVIISKYHVNEDKIELFFKQNNSIDDVFQEIIKDFEISNTELKFIAQESSIISTTEMKQWWKKNGARFDIGMRSYDRIDRFGRIYQTDNLSANNNAFFNVMHPNGKIVKSPSSGWRCSPETMNRWLSEDRIEFGKDENTVPRFRRLLSEMTSQLPKPTISKNRNGSRVVQAILGSKKFDFPKDHDEIMRWLKIVSHKNALILDFFAGSGTTGHAVAELNREDGGNRSAILVTNNEGGIARNVTRERLSRVLTGENWADGKAHEPLPGNLSFYTLGFKTLSSNPLTTAQMLEGKFDGLLSLANNALNVVENSADEDYAIYRNSEKVVFIWKNLFSLYDGECEELLESLESTMDAKEFIAYVPSDSKDPGISVDGWEVVAFPHEYIERYNAMISTMRRNQTLPTRK